MFQESVLSWLNTTRPCRSTESLGGGRGKDEVGGRNSTIANYLLETRYQIQN